MHLFILFPCLWGRSLHRDLRTLSVIDVTQLLQRLRDFQRVPRPSLCPRKKSDSAGSSWPYRDDWPGPNRDHRTAERGDHSDFPTGGETCGL